MERKFVRDAALALAVLGATGQSATAAAGASARTASAHRAAIAPFPGEGTAPASEPDAHRVALSRARAAALQTAARAAAPDADEQHLQSTVLDSPARWTSAYRVLAQKNDGATVTVRVEVDIDLLRLRKVLAPAPAAVDGADAYRLAPPQIDRCPEASALRAELDIELQGHGTFTMEGGREVAVAVSCDPPAAIAHTFVYAVRVRATVDAGAGAVEREAFGFGPTPERAARDGAARAAGAAASHALRADPGVVLVIAPPASGRAIVSLSRKLARSTPGVTGVRLAGAGAGGVVHLRLLGAATTSEIEHALRTLADSGAFTLTVVRKDANQIEITLS